MINTSLLNVNRRPTTKKDSSLGRKRVNNTNSSDNGSFAPLPPTPDLLVKVSSTFTVNSYATWYIVTTLAVYHLPGRSPIFEMRLSILKWQASLRSIEYRMLVMTRATDCERGESQHGISRALPESSAGLRPPGEHAPENTPHPVTIALRNRCRRQTALVHRLVIWASDGCSLRRKRGTGLGDQDMPIAN